MKTKKQKLKIVLASFAMLTTAGCATGPRVDPAAVGQIKKVAIVAFTTTLPASRQLSLDLGSGQTSDSSGGSQITENSKATDDILNSVAGSFAKKKSWQVMDVVSMKKNPAYVQAYKATMEGWQNKMPVGGDSKNYLVEGVMDKDGVRLLGPEGKNQLIRALKVDAVVVASVTTTLKGFTVMGIGKRKPQTTVSIQIFNLAKEDSIWSESFQGDESEESVGMTGFIDEQKLQTLALDSAKSALNKIQ